MRYKVSKNDSVGLDGKKQKFVNCVSDEVGGWAFSINSPLLDWVWVDEI